MVRERLEINPSDPYLIVSLAQLAVDTGRDEEALSALSRLEPLRDDVELMVFAAEAYAGLERTDKARELVRRALAEGYPYETLASNPSLKDIVSEVK